VTFNLSQEADAIRSNTKLLKEMAFQQAFEEMQRDAAEINKKNGFTREDELAAEFASYGLQSGRLSEIPSAIRNARAGLKLMLIVSEIGEALEAVRKNLGPDDHIPQFSAEEAEIADAVIRLMNYATDRKLRLAEALIEKNEYNRNRPDHTDRTGEHAKKF